MIFGHKWYAMRHINGGPWFAQRLLVVFGVPLPTMFFVVAGPFDSPKEACDECERREGGE